MSRPVPGDSPHHPSMSLECRPCHKPLLITQLTHLETVSRQYFPAPTRHIDQHVCSELSHGERRRWRGRIYKRKRSHTHLVRSIRPNSPDSPTALQHQTTQSSPTRHPSHRAAVSETAASPSRQTRHDTKEPLRAILPPLSVHAPTLHLAPLSPRVRPSFDVPITASYPPIP